MDDLLYYQLKAELALEAGDIEEAKVWAALANSTATALTARGPGTLRGPIPNDVRDELKERVKNGERPEFFGGAGVRPDGPPSPGGGRTPIQPTPGRGATNRQLG